MQVYELVEQGSEEGYAVMARVGLDGYLVAGVAEGETEEVDVLGLERVEVDHLFTMGDSTGAQYWYAFGILAYKAADGTLYGDAAEIDRNC